MDELERYLDRVCRGVGGPRSLRQHLRQELREHLLDAVAERKASGVPEGEALARALEDFGGPDEVHSEMTAAHGQRLLGVVIDRALEWKETTMRVKWLWTTWAYLAVIGVVVLNLLYIAFASTMQMPKLKKLRADGYIQIDELNERSVSWMYSYLDGVASAWNNALWWALGAVAAWGVFEWRARGENKSLVRLSALGSAAVVLTGLVVVAAVSMEVPLLLGMPAWGRIAEPWAAQQVAEIDASLGAIERARAANDWETVRDRLNRTIGATARLSVVAGSVKPRAAETASTAERREQLKAAELHLLDAQNAAAAKDAERLDVALRRFRAIYEANH